MRPKHQNGRFGGSFGSGRAKTEDLPWVSGPFDVVSAVAPLFRFSFFRFTLFLLSVRNRWVKVRVNRHHHIDL